MTNDPQTSIQETIESRKSRVRVLVTYAAAGWVFLGSILLIIFMSLVTIFANQYEQIVNDAKGVFTMVLPVATGIITYWFASRPQASSSSSNSSEQQQANEPENGEDEDGAEDDDHDAKKVAGPARVGQP